MKSFFKMMALSFALTTTPVLAQDYVIHVSGIV